MKFGFNFGLIGGSRDRIYTNCWDTLIQLTDGWYGYDTDQTPTGVLVPSVTSSGSTIHAYKFNTTTGEFRLEIGAAGDEELENTSMVLYQHGSDSIELFFDDVNNYYTGIDVYLASKVASEVDTKSCFNSLVVPELLIHYTYAELERVE